MSECDCDGAKNYQADKEGEMRRMDQVTAQADCKPEENKSPDMNYARGGWPRSG
jgi:hypothetical protein